MIENTSLVKSDLLIGSSVSNLITVSVETMSKYLGWGKQIGFRRYRNYLRTVDGIYTIMINKKE